VNAFREDSGHHEPCRAFLDETLTSPTAFGLTPIVLSGFLRIVNHSRIFKTPTPLIDALEFVEILREQPQAEIIEPGRRHWDIFTALAEEASARGNLIPDAYLAAIAIESGSEWVSVDGDFARFQGLRWIDPRAV
ncbi:MAG: type II toxin-antitoxin system VapC family toxin, partial [Actinomycetota bacterium]|nr:type II toxin-antitoxin system VapC family toxin [Actinomycetota bacterium]